MSYYPPVELWFFFEYDCPVCRPTYTRVLAEMEIKGLYHVKRIEVHAQDGTKEMEWYRNYSHEKWGGRFIVPTIKIPKLTPEGEPSSIGGDVYYVWVPQKHYGMTDEELSSLQLLKKQLLENHSKYVYPDKIPTQDYDIWERYGGHINIVDLIGR